MRIRRAPLVTLLASGLAAVGWIDATAAELDVHVELVALHPDGEPAEIVVVAEAEGAAGRSGERQEWTVEPGSWTLDLDAGRVWRLHAEAEGYWSAAVSTTTVSAGDGVELRLFPTGILRGELALAGDGALPSEIALELEGDASGGGRASIPDGEVVCPVEDARWRCAVPAGRLDLTLRASPFVAHRLWEIELAAGRVQDLGLFTLEIGGAIAGSVRAEDGRAAPEGARIELLRLGGAAVPAAGVVPSEASPDSDGGFAFGGLPASRYAVKVSAPDYLTATSAPIDVRAGDTYQLPEPLVLRRAVTLELLFTPPVTPDGEVWEFRLARRADGQPVTRGNYTGETDAGGYWREEGLEPGTYLLSLLGDIAPHWVAQEIDLKQSALVEVEIPLVAVEGEVSIGGEALAADLSFSNREAKKQVRLQSDETGFFSGLLPAAGVWQVQVLVPAERLNWNYGDVEVSSSGVGPTFIDIALPGTEIEGEVTDFNGRPVEGATVRIQRRGLETGSASFRTDADGRFRIRGLAPGSISIMASAGGKRSSWFQLVLEEGRPVPALQLVLR